MNPRHSDEPAGSRLPDVAFWRGKRVFLTGHTGFKGAWLATWLGRLEATVVGYARAPESGSLAEAMQINAPVQGTVGELEDLATLTAAMRAANPEIVLHLAAQSLVRRSYEAPIATLVTNAVGTAHVLEAIRAVGSVRAVVSVTTDKCYENREWVWPYRETDALGGHDLYSASKACAELVTHAYRRSFLAAGGVGVATARAGNVIGGGDWAEDRLVPDCIRAFRAGRPVEIRNPQATRPWQHVLEPLCGYLLLAEELWHGRQYAPAWNFGPPPQDARPVGWIVDHMIQRWGEGAARRPSEHAHPHEARSLAVDASLAQQQLGWSPRWGVETALQRTVDWYRQVGAGADAHASVCADIARYVAQAPTDP